MSGAWMVPGGGGVGSDCLNRSEPSRLNESGSKFNRIWSLSLLAMIT